jgi:hypothetical protein
MTRENQSNETMIEELMNLDPSNLTTWETDFLVNVEDKIQSGRELSDAQQEVLDKLYKTKF